jgi:putative phage-type endonuclease
MINDTQKKDRKLGIGGSDISIILGLSQYKTPYQLWLEKTDQFVESNDETEYQYWGSVLEPVIREEFIKKNNVVVETPDTIVHPLFDFMRGNIDGFIPSLNAVLEIKTTAGYNIKDWGEPNTDQIPLYYLVQVAYYCAITNADCAYIAVLIGGNTYKEYKYKRDYAIEEKLIDEAKKFWNCVQNNIEPELVNIDDLKLKYPSGSPEKTIKINDKVQLSLNTITETKRKIKELTEIEGKAKFELIKYMEDSEKLEDELGNTLASYKPTKRGRTLLIKGVN